MILSQFYQAFFLSLFAGLSTIIGAFIVFFIKHDNLRFLGFGLGFSAGAMIYISFVEILPQAILDFSKLYPSMGEIYAILCFFGGIFVSAFIDSIIPEEINPHEKTNSLKRVGVFTAIVVGIHNFPEGFATFASSLESLSFGLMIAIAVAIHNIPEGVVVSLPIYHATKSKKKAIVFSALSGIAEPIGAIIGIIIIFPIFGKSALSFSLAFAAGIMVFISLDELLPSARQYGKSHDSLYGLILGMLMMAISIILLKKVGI